MSLRPNTARNPYRIRTDEDWEDAFRKTLKNEAAEGLVAKDEEKNVEGEG